MIFYSEREIQQQKMWQNMLVNQNQQCSKYVPHIQGVWLHFHITFDVERLNNDMDSKANKSSQGIEQMIQKYVEYEHKSSKQNMKSKK